MGLSGEIVDRESSESSAILLSKTSGRDGSHRSSKSHDSSHGSSPSQATDATSASSSAPPTNFLLVIWNSIVSTVRSFGSYLYRSTVVWFAEFVCDVLSHPRLQDLVVEMIVSAINGFMEQEDIGTKMDQTAKKVMYDPDKAREAAHHVGKEVVPMVAGFVGGITSSLHPKSIRKRKLRRKTSRQNRDTPERSKPSGDDPSHASDRTASHASSGRGYHSDPMEVLAEDNDDSDDSDAGGGHWFSSKSSGRKK